MTTPTSATDRLDILAVLARHAYATDHADHTLLGETVTADARVQTFAALPQIADGTTRETVLRNALVTIDGDGDGDGARATVIGELGLVVLELHGAGGATRHQHDATAIDSLVRTSHGWRLSARVLHLADVEVGAVTVPADRRDLIANGAALLADASFLGAGTGDTGETADTGDTGAPAARASEILDIEAALSHAAFTRDRAATRSGLLSSRHLVSNVKATVDGDLARSESEFVRTTLAPAENDATTRRRTSGVEITELHRAGGGWTVGERTEHIKSDVVTTAGLDAAVLERITTASNALGELDPTTPDALGPVIDDRLEIRELLIRYSSAFDQERWHLVDDVFTHDVVFGAEAVGVATGTAQTFVDQAKALYHDRLTGLHSIAEPVLRIEADRAWGYTDFTTIAIHDPSGTADSARTAGSLDRLRSGGFYVDEFTRTTHGWRISRRVVAFSSSVRDTIEALPGIRDTIATTRAALR